MSNHETLKSLGQQEQFRRFDSDRKAEVRPLKKKETIFDRAKELLKKVKR